MPPETSIGLSRSGVPWGRVALVVWAVALLVIALRVAFYDAGHSVYAIFATAGQRWTAGTDLYRAEAESYRYSPLATVLLVPFAQLPDAVGGVAWRLLNVVALLAGAAWWLRVAVPETVGRITLGMFLLVLAPLAIGNLNNGQSNALMLGLLLAALAAAKRELWWIAALGVALATFLKLYPAALGLLLVLYAPGRFGPRFAFLMVLGFWLPFLCQHPAYVLEQYAGWWTNLQSDDRTFFPLEFWYRDVRLLFAWVGLRPSRAGYLMLETITGIAAAVAVVLGMRGRRSPQQVLFLLFGLGCVWMTAFGPAAESSTYVLLAPTVACLLVASCQGRTERVAGVLAVTAYGLLILAQMASWFPVGRAVHSVGPQPLAALLLGAALIRRPRPAVPSPVASVVHVRTRAAA